MTPDLDLERWQDTHDVAAAGNSPEKPEPRPLPDLPPMPRQPDPAPILPRHPGHNLTEAAEMRDELKPLHPDATGLTLFRVLPSGEGRAYSSVEFVSGWRGVNHFLRILNFCGYVKDSDQGSDGWHVLDVLNAEGDIIQDYAVPPGPSKAATYITRKLGLRVDRSGEQR